MFWSRFWFRPQHHPNVLHLIASNGVHCTGGAIKIGSFPIDNDEVRIFVFLLVGAALASSSYVRPSRSTVFVARPRKLALCPCCHVSAPHCSALRSCAMIHSIAARLAACTSVARGCCVFEIPGQISRRVDTQNTLHLLASHTALHIFTSTCTWPHQTKSCCFVAHESQVRKHDQMFFFLKKKKFFAG